VLYLAGYRSDLTMVVSLFSVVVMEGNPHPGAVKGRMSFQNFNPSIDVSSVAFFQLHVLLYVMPNRSLFPHTNLDL
jgi:hypothetical protein